METYDHSQTNDNLEKQDEPNKNLIEQVASHGTMIEELNKSIASILILMGCNIKRHA
jgi:hypothetical protein